MALNTLVSGRGEDVTQSDGEDVTAEHVSVAGHLRVCAGERSKAGLCE